MNGLGSSGMKVDHHIVLLLNFRRFWISSLFNTLFPPLSCLGHFSNLDISTIPEAPRAFNVLYEYCREIIFCPTHMRRDPTLLTSSYQVMRIAFYVDKRHFQTVVPRSPLDNLLRTVQDFNLKSRDVAIPILRAISITLDGSLYGITLLRYVQF